jgi:hypothetical protein
MERPADPTPVTPCCTGSTHHRPAPSHAHSCPRGCRPRLPAGTCPGVWRLWSVWEVNWEVPPRGTPRQTTKLHTHMPARTHLCSPRGWGRRLPRGPPLARQPRADGGRHGGECGWCWRRGRVCSRRGVWPPTLARVAFNLWAHVGQGWEAGWAANLHTFSTCIVGTCPTTPTPHAPASAARRTPPPPPPF